MDSVWWTKITNAANFLKLIIDNVESGKSVVLRLPDSVPWRQTMRASVENEIIKMYSERSCKFVSDNGTDPGEYLASEYCTREKRMRYRPSIGYPEFLAKSDDIVLSDYILWIADISREQADKWYNFIVEYNKALGKEGRGCQFILETSEENNVKDKKGLKVIDYSKEIESYDNYLFNMLASSELKESEIFKRYLAEAISAVVADDIELSALCAARGRAFLKSPISFLNVMADSRTRSDGSYFNVCLSEKQLNDRLWEAQIKVIFPLIEKSRNKIVQKYISEIESILPIKAAYGEEFTQAADVELGTICFLAGTGKIRISSDDYFSVVKLKNARNLLAHLSSIPLEDVDEIIKVTANI